MYHIILFTLIHLSSDIQLQFHLDRKVTIFIGKFLTVRNFIF